MWCACSLSLLILTFTSQKFIVCIYAKYNVHNEDSEIYDYFVNVNYWYSNICILVFQWIWTVHLNSILWTPILSQYYYIYNASYAFRLCAYNWNLSNQISPYTFKKGDHDVHNMYRKCMPYININTDQKVKKKL